MSNDQDAQHPASPIRLQQAHRDGEFPRSFELAVSIQLLCSSVACYFFAKTSAHQFTVFTSRIWSRSDFSIFDVEQFDELFRESATEFIYILTPLLGMILLFGFLSHVLQNTSFSFFNRPIFETANLNPANNLQRIFSSSNLIRGILSLPKTTLVVFVAGLVIWQLSTSIANLPYQATDKMLIQLLDCVFAVLIAATGTMASISIFDYLIERFSFARRHRMTDEQLREENRLQNVDPQIQSQRSQLYQELM